MVECVPVAPSPGGSSAQQPLYLRTPVNVYGVALEGVLVPVIYEELPQRRLPCCCRAARRRRRQLGRAPPRRGQAPRRQARVAAACTSDAATQRLHHRTHQGGAGAACTRSLWAQATGRRTQRSAGLLALSELRRIAELGRTNAPECGNALPERPACASPARAALLRRLAGRSWAPFVASATYIRRL